VTFVDEPWRLVIDSAVKARLDNRELSFEERSGLAHLAVIAAARLPRDQESRALFSSVARDDLGVIRGLEVSEGDDSLPSLFTLGRSVFLLAKRDVEVGSVSVATCIALHSCNRSEAADGLFALAALRINSQNVNHVRFYRQATSHLSALVAFFADQKTEQVLRLARLLEARG
jgi:hypothetical protein